MDPRPSDEVTQETPATTPAETLDRRGIWRRFRWLLLLLALALVLGATTGYVAGTRQREQTRQASALETAREQFELGLQDLQARRFELARQRFEYVIRLDPTYPDAPQRLAESLLALNVGTATPASLPTPTPNLAPVQDLLTQAHGSLAAKDWTAAIDTLIALRAKDASFKSVEVDGMFYNALRNRGVQRISEQGLLEEGIYDLSRAERFAPLDRDADNWRNWAQMYLQADSYMGLNWGKAFMAFAQVFAVSPYLKNDAYLKYAMAGQAYGDQLVAADDPCAARQPYEESLRAWQNATLVPTATKVYHQCQEATRPPDTATPPAATSTQEGPPPEAPTETPTETQPTP